MALSTVIAGCMRWGKWGANFSLTQYEQLINQCLQKNITSFDHADIYGDYTTEAEFGAVLKRNSSLRGSLQIISKCGIQLVCNTRPQHQIKSYNTSKQHIIQSVEQSLLNFNTDYLDVLLLHRPNPLLNPIEVAEAISTLLKQGKIIEFGVSNFLPHQVDVLIKHIPINYNQIELSITHLLPFSNGVLNNCLQHCIKPMAWGALGGGLLNDDAHPRYRAIYSVAADLCAKYRTGINQILIAFLLLHPAQILPVVGSTKIERLVQATNAAEINLNSEDWFKLYAASIGEDVA